MSDLLFGRRTIRIGVTGLSRAGKTAFLTSVAANLLAMGAGLDALPALGAAIGGRPLRASVAPSGVSSVPRFDVAGHLAALAADPPRWPERTDTVSRLALNLDVPRGGLGSALPPRRVRLEMLDYPGEWLLDLTMLTQDYAAWSRAALIRLRAEPEVARPFLDFIAALPAKPGADEALAAAGHALYRTTLLRLRDERGLVFLQPGRFLMPAPGGEPPWMAFFPLPDEAAPSGGLRALLAARYDAYRRSVGDMLVEPLFGDIDRLVVLADLLTALHSGFNAYYDIQAALGAAATAVRRLSVLFDPASFLRALAVPEWLLGQLPVVPRLPAWLGGGGLQRVAFAATKADHIAERQRGNLRALMRALIDEEATGSATTRAFAIAAVRCTEDFVWTLEGRPVSAVRGRVLGEERMTRSYPGEVPDQPPDPAFFAHRFLALPDFEPRRLPADGRAGVSHIGLDSLLAFLLEDVL